MSGFNEMAFRKKCEELNPTQQSIQGMSTWLIHHRKHVDTIVNVYYKEFTKAKDSRKMTFIYLANDIVQNSRKKEPQLGKAFIPTLRKVFEDMGQVKDDKTKDNILRILNIWKERGTFESALIQEFHDGYLKCFSTLQDDDDDVDNLIKGITTPPQPSFALEPPFGTDNDGSGVKVKPPVRKSSNDRKSSTMHTPSRRRPSRKSSSEATHEDGAGTHQVRLAPPRSTDQPEEDDLIRLLKGMWNMPSTDAATREKIASLPPEVADPSGVEAICVDSDASRQFTSKVGTAQSFLEDYNEKLDKELADRKKFTGKLQNFHASQKDLLGQAEYRLQEHRRHEALLRKRLEELKAHIQNMPDIKKATEDGSLKPLPSAGELFLNK